MTDSSDQLPLPGLYGDGARALQDHFDSRRLADLLVELTVHTELSDDDIDLIRTQSTAWISTVDEDGWPDVSYKGGEPGFVRVTGPTSLELPAYDGNGMFRSLGNIIDNGRVALLFVDPARPWRLRLHGTAEVSTNPELLEAHYGAVAVVAIAIGRVFPNCGRYIHGSDLSDDLPVPGRDQPIPGWKWFEVIRAALPEQDRLRVEAAMPPD